VAKLRDWATRNRLTLWIGVTAGALLGALVTRDVRGGAVTAAVGAFLVVLSLVVNRTLDWWEGRRGSNSPKLP
jgi:predicted MFS family arabinose efflux permease